MTEKLTCICNEVPEDEIIRIIKSNKDLSLHDISEKTSAGTGCGRCRRSIRLLLKKFAKD